MLEIKIPAIGESVQEATIGQWRKNDGEAVAKDEVLVDLETDKVTQELYAPMAGVLRIAAKAGETLAIGSVIGRIEAGTGAAAQPPEAPASPAGGEAVKTAGGAVAASAKVSAGAAGATSAVAAGAPAAAASAGQGGGAGGALDVARAPVGPGESVTGMEQRASPLAVKYALDKGVDITQVTGTGPHGRVQRRDVDAFLVHRDQAASLARAVSAAPAASVSAGGVAQRNVTREPMSQLRRRIAERLVEAQHTAAMLTTFNEVDMSAVMALRKKYKDEFEKLHGVGLGFMSFFVSAVCSGLKAQPRVNAQIQQDADGRSVVVQHHYVDMGVAVSTPRGLMVPVIRNAESLDFAGVEAAIRDVAVRARDGKISVDELTGGTFTITNGGIFGSLLSTPILNPPQSGILGMHTIKDRPVAVEGRVEIRPMMYLALSYDHRIVDGAEAVRFLVHVKEHIEQPERLLLGL